MRIIVSLANIHSPSTCFSGFLWECLGRHSFLNKIYSLWLPLEEILFPRQNHLPPVLEESPWGPPSGFRPPYAVKMMVPSNVLPPLAPAHFPSGWGFGPLPWNHNQGKIKQMTILSYTNWLLPNNITVKTNLMWTYSVHALQPSGEFYRRRWRNNVI